jgi:tetratricopeptide (TPR) repeat protein
LAPENLRYRRERAYANGAVCAVAVRPPADVELAVSRCRAALEQTAALAQTLPDHPEIAADLANRHAFLGDAYRQAGDLRRAEEERRREGAILERLLARDPKNMKLKYAWVGQQRALAGLEGLRGRRGEALRRLRAARAALDPLLAHDPENREWRALRDRIDATIIYFTPPTNPIAG